MLYSLRTRPDNTHIPFQDINELRELVQAGLTDKLSDRRHPLVILCRRDDLSLFLCVLDHASELMDGEHLPVDRTSVLTEKDRSAVIQLDCHRNDQHDR